MFPVTGRQRRMRQTMRFSVHRNRFFFLLLLRRRRQKDSSPPPLRRIRLKFAASTRLTKEELHPTLPSSKVNWATWFLERGWDGIEEGEGNEFGNAENWRETGLAAAIPNSASTAFHRYQSFAFREYLILNSKLESNSDRKHEMFR